jgi:chorismate dehydratase
VSEPRRGLRLAVPDLPAAHALAVAWGGGTGPVADTETMAPEDAERALRAGRVDLAFVPTLAILRDPDAFSVVPGVALVGRAYRPAHLHLPEGLAPFTPGRQPRVGVHPLYAQEALLARVLLKEHYGATPTFVPFEGEPPAGLDGVVLPPGGDLPPAGVTLDLGAEWFELTTRPMVWALLAAPAGGVSPEEALFLRDAAVDLFEDADPLATEEPGGVTLAAYAHAGLDDWVNYLFYLGTLEELPQVPFIVIPGEDGEQGEEPED